MFKFKKKVNYIASSEMQILLRHYKNGFFIEKMFCDLLGIKHYKIIIFGDGYTNSMTKYVYINYDKDSYGEVMVEKELYIYANS